MRSGAGGVGGRSPPFCPPDHSAARDAPLVPAPPGRRNLPPDPHVASGAGEHMREPHDNHMNRTGA